MCLCYACHIDTVSYIGLIEGDLVSVIVIVAPWLIVWWLGISSFPLRVFIILQFNISLVSWVCFVLFVILVWASYGLSLMSDLSSLMDL